MGGPAKRQESGPAPGAKDGSNAIESRADELQAEMARWSAALQAEHNVGDGGDAEAYAVHHQLAARSKEPSDLHQRDGTEHANGDGDLEAGQKSEHGALTV